MQAMLPGFLDHAMKAFSEQQAHMRAEMDKALRDNPLRREFYRNEETVSRSALGASSYRAPIDHAEADEEAAVQHGDLDDLRKQLQVLQSRIDNM